MKKSQIFKNRINHRVSKIIEDYTSEITYAILEDQDESIETIRDWTKFREEYKDLLNGDLNFEYILTDILLAVRAAVLEKVGKENEV